MVNKASHYIFITRQRIPAEVRGVDPENLAFLSVMDDFGLTSISNGCLCIRTALFEALRNPDFLDRSPDELFCEIARIREISDTGVQKSMCFALETLWCSCDEVRLINDYFGSDDIKMPYYTEVSDFMRFLYFMLAVKLKKYKGAV